LHYKLSKCKPVYILFHSLSTILQLISEIMLSTLK